MNAMMSTDTRRYDGHGDAAMREARRILSVAEPDSDGVALPPCRIRPWLEEGAVGSLVEALACFVSAPDPAAYLAARVAR